MGRSRSDSRTRASRLRKCIGGGRRIYSVSRRSRLKLTQTFPCFLTRGEKWTPEKTPATEEIQKGHMANINKLAEMKKLVAAGPFGDNGRLRGIFVFRVASLDEARR